jgi:hypothetical protein
MQTILPQNFDALQLLQRKCSALYARLEKARDAKCARFCALGYSSTRALQDKVFLTLDSQADELYALHQRESARLCALYDMRDAQARIDAEWAAQQENEARYVRDWSERVEEEEEFQALEYERLEMALSK